MTKPAPSKTERVGWKKTLLACVVILLLGGAATTVIFFTEPTAKRSGATKETAMLVNVIEVESGNYRPTITAMGTVEPTRDIILQPRVGGEIVEKATAFTPGGFVEKGELLLQIDPSDYENALQQSRSDLRQANADLTIEMGFQDVARRDYQLLNDAVTVENEALVLRQPQLNAVQARVEAATAAVAQAEANLERTRLKAPFDARILARNVDLGSQVSPGDDLGRLVGLDQYWVVASVPLGKLRWLAFADGTPDTGAPVRIRNRTAWPDSAFRTGYLDKLVGTLESETRMAKVLVTVPDPLGLESDSPEAPPLIIGAFVEARIEGRELTDVVRLDRDYVRQGDTVWVMEDGLLAVREVEILLRDAEYAYLTSGLNAGDRVVTTNLATVVEGSALRLETAAESVPAKPDAPEARQPHE